MTNYELLEVIGGVDEALILPCLEPRKTLRLRKSVRAAILLAAVLLLLTTAALAMSGRDGFLSSLFGESYDIIGDYVMMEPITAENEKVRLTVESALSDGFNAYVVYSVERLDGGTLEGYYLDIEITPQYGSQGYAVVGHQAWGQKLETGNETPYKEWHMWFRSGKSGIEAMNLRLLGLRNTATGETVDFGEVKLSVPLKHSPVKLAEAGSDPMGRDVYKNIVLTPLGFRMDAWINLHPLSTDGSGENQRNRDYSKADCTVVLVYKDGTEQDISERLSRRLDAAKDEIKAVFEKPLDIEQIKGLRLNGAYLELAYGEPEPLRMVTTAGTLLTQNREYTYGAHEPLCPQITAESETRELALESIWTDGRTAELWFYMTFADGERDFRHITSYLENGLLEFRALDRNGAPLALAAEMMSGYRVTEERILLGCVVQIGGEGETLIIAQSGAELNISLDMKKLKKLPQGTMYVEPPKETPTESEPKSDIYQEHYDNLFGYRTPDKVDISADNGEYRITVEYLWQSVTQSTGKLRAMIRCERLDGEKFDTGFVPGRKETEIGVMLDGEFRAATGVDGGFGNGWVDGNAFYRAAEIEYDFPPGDRDAVRLTWTPPSGARITLDLPVE